MWWLLLIPGVYFVASRWLSSDSPPPAPPIPNNNPTTPGSFPLPGNAAPAVSTVPTNVLKIGDMIAVTPMPGAQIQFFAVSGFHIEDSSHVTAMGVPIFTNDSPSTIPLAAIRGRVGSFNTALNQSPPITPIQLADTSAFPGMALVSQLV